MFSAEKGILYEIYWEMSNILKEAYFNQNMFTNGKTMYLPVRANVKKTVYGVEIH